MVDGSVVRVDAAEVVAAGWIALLTPRTVKVAIVTPFSGLYAEQSLPCFVAGLAAYQKKNGMITPLGIDAAERLLRQLCESCVVFTQHRDELSLAYRGFLGTQVDERRESNLRNAWIAQKRRTLRSDFREGRISNAEYQQCLGPLKRAVPAALPVKSLAEQDLSLYVQERYGLHTPGAIGQIIAAFLM